MKKCAILIILILFCFSGFTPKKQEVLNEKEMSQLMGKAGGVYFYCWSYGCQPEFPGINNCPAWTGPPLDTENICDYCAGQQGNTGKFCKPTTVHIFCRVWGWDNICGQKQKGICRYRYDEETEQYLSYCDFGGQTTPDYGMCIWGWQFCEQWPAP